MRGAERFVQGIGLVRENLVARMERNAVRVSELRMCDALGMRRGQWINDGHTFEGSDSREPCVGCHEAEFV